MASDSTSTPAIVFLGPSIPIALAKAILPNADYRPPVRRGDLENIAAGRVVGIIDGVFAQDLAVSSRNVDVYGASSMGALRAAEVRGAIGIGSVYQMYKTGTIDRDDEVALLFDPETYEAVTVPLVNVRYAASRLVRSGTLDHQVADAIFAAAKALHYTERTYPNIIRHTKLAGTTNADSISQLFKSFDLKRDDAQLLLETLSVYRPRPSAPEVKANIETTADYDQPQYRVRGREAPEAELIVWEYGDQLSLVDLIQFLKITGRFESVARAVLGRFSVAGVLTEAADSPVVDETDSQSILDFTRMVWGWETPEEAHVTLRDLGVGLEDIADSLDAELSVRRAISRFGTSTDGALTRGLRVELWLNDLSLKREILRLGALRYFSASASSGPPANTEETESARRCVCRLLGVLRWSDATLHLQGLGISPAELDCTVESIALARRNAYPLLLLLDRPNVRIPSPGAKIDEWLKLGFDIERGDKAAGSPRFAVAESVALANTTQIAAQIGILRIGLIGELDNLGIHVAQAFGDRSGWSSSFSSGKSESEVGARVGSVMEEAEIFAQDAFRAPEQQKCSYLAARTLELRDGIRFVDPQTLGLPYDSKYTTDLELTWSRAPDLITCSTVLVPSAALSSVRVPNDIFYSARLGAKWFSSSGLGSGFTLAEATVHAAGEYIERHAWRLAELQIDNPGGIAGREFRFLKNTTLPPEPSRLVRKFENAGMVVRILNITSEIAIPTFAVKLYEDPFDNDTSISCDGYACHPNPAVAITMALLEAAQTRAGAIAGAREDYALKARSLGRHERPRTVRPASQIFWFGNDSPTESFDTIDGFVSRNLSDELGWIVDRVAAAGYRHLLAVDYTVGLIRPAFAVRVVIPGVETTNPFYTGERARALSIRDLLPRT
jgi:ribosomal protein S12 methylthiotransferase accessory factor